MRDLLKRLAEGPALLLDGATGTELERRGHRILEHGTRRLAQQPAELTRMRRDERAFRQAAGKLGGLPHPRVQAVGVHDRRLPRLARSPQDRGDELPPARLPS